jgi:hypothetical protein
MCVVTPLSTQVFDMMVTGTVILSAGAGEMQLHWRLEYTADAALPGTLPLEFVMLSEQLPSLGTPVCANSTSQVAGLVLATLIGIDTVAPLSETAVAGATTFVSVPVSPLDSKVQVDIVPAGTSATDDPSGIITTPNAAVKIEYAFFSVLPHLTLLV